jgi:hypothetical protein
MKIQYLQLVLLGGVHTLFGAFEVDVEFLPNICSIVNIDGESSEGLSETRGITGDVHYEDERLV